MSRTANSLLISVIFGSAVLFNFGNSEENHQHVRDKRQMEQLNEALKTVNRLTKGSNEGNEPQPQGGASGPNQYSPYGGGGYPPVPNYNPYGGGGGYPQYNPYYPYYPSQYPYNSAPDYQINVHNRNGAGESGSGGLGGVLGVIPNGGNLNINIPSGSSSQAAQPLLAPNINNVIYGPAPPSSVNNNFYGAPSPPQSSSTADKKEKFCNANTEFNCYNGNCLSDPHQLCDGKNDCGNRVDELNCNHLNYQIRLRSENDEADTHAQFGSRFNGIQSSSGSHVISRHEGIIEVSVKGQRGCVCNRNFDIHDADVACRELGFRKGCDKLNRVSRTKASELYSDGVPYLMDNVNCIGNETSIRDCDFNGWGRADRSCGRRNIVSITCKTDISTPPPPLVSRFNMDEDIEMNPQYPLPPPIQRFYDNPPPPLPPPASFNPAPVPFPNSPPTSAPFPPSSNTGFSAFNRNTTSIFHRDETQVTGQATGSTENCPSNQFGCKGTKKCIPIDRICDRYSDCEDNSDETFEGCNQPIQIRLSNGAAVSEGRLEIRVHGIWGTVCDKSFGVNEAGVFCRSLGFLGQPQIIKNATVAEGQGPIWLDSLACPTDDTCCLTSCHNLYWGRSSCSHSQDVVLRCSNLLRFN